MFSLGSEKKILGVRAPFFVFARLIEKNLQLKGVEFL